MPLELFDVWHYVALKQFYVLLFILPFIGEVSSRSGDLCTTLHLHSQQDAQVQCTQFCAGTQMSWNGHWKCNRHFWQGKTCPNDGCLCGCDSGLPMGGMPGMGMGMPGQGMGMPGQMPFMPQMSMQQPMMMMMPQPQMMMQPAAYQYQQPVVVQIPAQQQTPMLIPVPQPSTTSTVLQSPIMVPEIMPANYGASSIDAMLPLLMMMNNGRRGGGHNRRGDGRYAYGGSGMNNPKLTQMLALTSLLSQGPMIHRDDPNALSLAASRNISVLVPVIYAKNDTIAVAAFNKSKSNRDLLAKTQSAIKELQVQLQQSVEISKDINKILSNSRNVLSQQPSSAVMTSSSTNPNLIISQAIRKLNSASSTDDVLSKPESADWSTGESLSLKTAATASDGGDGEEQSMADSNAESDVDELLGLKPSASAASSTNAIAMLKLKGLHQQLLNKATSQNQQSNSATSRKAKTINYPQYPLLDTHVGSIDKVL